MKHYVLTVTGLLTVTLSFAQAPTAGVITYEGMRRVDPSQMRMVINGQEVRPGTPLPNGQMPDLPEVMNFNQSLEFAGGWAMEKRERSGAMMRTVTMGGPDGPGGPPPGAGPGDPGSGGPHTNERRFNRPFEDVTYVDLINGQTVTVLSVKKDSVTTDYYRALRPLKRDSLWQETGKTKKLLGYTCRKATSVRRGQPCTIWYTTDLPFTYSPVATLTPEKGVVLQIESDDEAFKATKIEAKPIDEASLKPTDKAKVVSWDELETMRRKAMTSFRQRMMAQFPLTRN